MIYSRLWIPCPSSNFPGLFVLVIGKAKMVAFDMWVGAESGICKRETRQPMRIGKCFNAFAILSIAFLPDLRGTEY
jgi:hypothetical protein